MVLFGLRGDIMDEFNLGQQILSSGIQPIVQTTIDVWLKPKMELLKSKFGKTAEELTYFFDNPLSTYLDTMYYKSGLMNTVIFHQKPVKLEDLYIPLELRNNIDEIRNYTVDYNVQDFIEKYDKLMITDLAGMGKSTVIKWMFRRCLEYNVGVPILIELKKINNDNSITDEIYKELNGLKEDSVSRDFIINLILEGNFIFFLDGFDEIPLDSREKVTTEIQEFIVKANKNKFIISSRHDPVISSFSGFYNFSINPLTPPKAYEMLRKYASVYGTEEIVEQLIEKVQSEANFKNLESFLSNPLMVSLLYMGYDFKQTISYKKSVFYRQVYDALFEKHDLTKGGAFTRPKRSGLDSDSFHCVLRSLGYITFKRGELYYTKDQIIKFLNDTRDLCQIDFNSNSFLEDLTLHVPLFYREGETYRWNHKSLQEYFAACYICTDAKEHQSIILEGMYNSSKRAIYINLMDLCYDLDIKTFKKTVIKSLLKDIQAHYTLDYPSHLTQKEVERRKAINYYYQVVLEISSNKQSWEEHQNIGKMFEMLDNPLKVGLTEEKNVNIYYTENKYEPFIRLLSDKNEKFIVPSKVIDGNFQDSLEFLKHTFLCEEDIFYLVGNLTNNEFMSNEVFKAVNDYVEHWLPSYPKIDIEIVNEMLEEIDNIKDSTDLFTF